MQVYNSSPQVSGFDPAEIEKISSNNEVIPVETTVDQLLDFVCMPVTIKNVTIEQAGTWKQEENKYVTHKFKVSGADLTVYINKGAEIFKDKPFAAKTGSITGIAAAYKTDAQILPRNLDDVKDFDLTQPAILSISPTTLHFPSTGDVKIITVTTVNQGNSPLLVSDLVAPLSATVTSNNTITVTAEKNSGGAIEQTLTISLLGGNSIPVKITQDAQGATAQVYKKVTEAPLDWSGKYIITYTSEDGSVVNILTGKGGTNIGDYKSITTEYDHSTGTIVANENTIPYTCTITKSENDGEYTILLGETYLGLTAKSNNLYFGTSATASGYQWKFEGTKIIPIKYIDRNLQWNNNSGQYRFACYTGTQKDVTLYKLSD